MLTLKYGMYKLECGVLTLEHGMYNLECGMFTLRARDAKSRVRDA